MCGIPMLKKALPDAVTGRTLTFEQALEHIGGLDNIVSEHGRWLIHHNAKHYLWKYPDKTTWCTACGKPIDNFYGHHGQGYICPICAMPCEFRYAAKGHKYVYDSFYLYEWRRSALDDQTIVLTGAYVSRSFRDAKEPHAVPLEVDPSALYIFRPGKAVTVYKQRWHWGRNGWVGEWEKIQSVHPEHSHHGTKCEIVLDYGEFRRALEGTRIGETFEALREASGKWETLELGAVANCARRPWLEYLYKSGQRYLASELMRMESVGREIVPNRYARTPRELLGLTEGQWYEVRRDGYQLTADELEALHILERLYGRPAKVAEADALARRYTSAAWMLRELLPQNRPGWGASIGDYLMPLPDKLRRRILRRIIGDLANGRDWRDYYRQLERLGEDMTDPALMLPRDLKAMHERMTERENALKAEEEARKSAAKDAVLAKRIADLRRRFTYRAAGLILRPYESAREIIEEGQRLHICIGGYVDSYVNGRTVICCLRRAEEPDVPWRAVEFSTQTGKMVQDRGLRNDANGIPPGVRAQLRNFWRAWDRARKSKEHKERMRVSA